MLLSPSPGHVWFLRVQRAPWDSSWILCSRHSSLSHCQPSPGVCSGFSFKICIALRILCGISTSCLAPWGGLRNGSFWICTPWILSQSPSIELTTEFFISLQCSGIVAVSWEFSGIGRAGEHGVSVLQGSPKAKPWHGDISSLSLPAGLSAFPEENVEISGVLGFFSPLKKYICGVKVFGLRGLLVFRI